MPASKRAYSSAQATASKSSAKSRPKSPLPPSAHAWDESIAAIHRDLKTFIALIEKPTSDLYKPFRWGDGQNLLREALLIADHNAYHIGELILLRRLLGAWHK